MIMHKKVAGTVEARMSSTRLPGKVLMPLAGEPALKRLVDRMRQSRYLDEIVIATTINPNDEKIVNFCRVNNIKFHRGSEEDVLKRILEAAKSVNADLMVQITGDCPLIDAKYIDMALEVFAEGGYDYVSNALVPSFPDGFNVQVYPVSVLEEVDKLTEDPIDRVHGSHYIYKHPEKFRLKNIKAEGKMYWPDLRVTLDEADDYELINSIFENFIPHNPYFSAEEVVDFLRKNPELLEINKNVRRKSAYEG